MNGLNTLRGGADFNYLRGRKGYMDEEPIHCQTEST